MKLKARTLNHIIYQTEAKIHNQIKSHTINPFLTVPFNLINFSVPFKTNLTLS